MILVTQDCDLVVWRKLVRLVRLESLEVVKLDAIKLGELEVLDMVYFVTFE